MPELREDEDATAQDVIDAMRLAFMGQKDDAERVALADMLLDLAPETDSNRGIGLLLHLIAEASVRVSVVQGGESDA